MFRGIILSLFAGTLVTGLASTASAQQANGYTTLSGESLRGLDGKNVSEDFRPPAVSGTSSTSTIPSMSAREKKPESDSNTRKPLPYTDQFDVSTGGSSLNSEEVFKVRYRLTPGKN
jgi:hypothetical protein